MNDGENLHEVELIKPGKDNLDADLKKKENKVHSTGSTLAIPGRVSPRGGPPGKGPPGGRGPPVG